MWKNFSKPPNRGSYYIIEKTWEQKKRLLRPTSTTYQNLAGIISLWIQGSAARNARKGYNWGAQSIFLGGITGSIGYCRVCDLYKVPYQWSEKTYL